MEITEQQLVESVAKRIKAEYGKYNGHLEWELIAAKKIIGNLKYLKVLNIEEQDSSVAEDVELGPNKVTEVKIKVTKISKGKLEL